MQQLQLGDVKPGSSGATDVATSGSGPLLPAGSVI
ncbi:hypothetical protein HaLaN_12027, partial [Haematococcus lacustris]